MNETIGRRVHVIMWERRLKQRELAELLGMSQQAVSRKMRGQRAFGVDELLEVAAWLDVPITDLLPRKDSNLQPAGYRYWLAAVAA